MSTPDDKLISNTLDEFLQYATEVPDNARLTLTGALIETARLAAQAVPADKHESAYSPLCLAMMGLFDLPLGALSFSPYRVLMSKTADAYFHDDHDPAARTKARTNALRVFVNMLQLDPEAATQDLLLALLQEEVSALSAKPPTPLPVTPPGKTFWLNQVEPVLTAFDPLPFVRNDEYKLSLVQYQTELPSGQFGPLVWAIAYLPDNQTAHLLLETGEYVVTPAHSLLLATPASVQDVPVYLMLCASVFIPQLLSTLGAVTEPHKLSQISALFGRIARGQAIYANASAATADAVSSGKVVVILPGTAHEHLHVALYTVNAPNDTPAICADLIREDGHGDVVLARNERPREFTARGVYVFLHAPYVIALTVL